MKRFILILSLFIVNLSFGSVELINMSTRPTIVEVMKHKEQVENINSSQLVSGDRFALDHFKKTLKEDAPQFIVKLEKAYPNAVFFFLGRDTQLISDVVEAFYQSIGNKDRVKRIGVSTPTLASLSDKEILNYLEQYGITIEAIEKSKKPFIMIDTISKGESINNTLISGRQGRALLQVVYRKWISLGKDPKVLLKKFNMIGMQVSTFRQGNADNNYRYKYISEIEDIHSINADRLSNPKLDSIGRDFMISLIPDTNKIFNEAGYDHYTATWHGKFNPPKEVNGSLMQNPGELMPINYRMSVLWMLNEVINFVFKDEFKQRVFEEAQKYNVKFIERSAAIQEVNKEAKVSENRKFISSLKKLEKQLSVLGEEYSYEKYTVLDTKMSLTENGYQLTQEVFKDAAISSEKYFDSLITYLIRFYSENKIGARDLRRIFSLALSLKSIENSKIDSIISKNLPKSEALRAMFLDEKNRDKLSSASGLLQENYLNLINKLPTSFSCKEIL